MKGIYLLLGTNLGDRLQNLRKAMELLSQKNVLTIEESSIYETEPWGKPNQPWFLNILIEVMTNLTPTELLKGCLEVEKEIGRVREERWKERIIDIDIIYYNNEVISTADLNLPHPEIPNRKFTLIPLVELNPFDIHPILKKSSTELLAATSDQLDCRLTDFKL